MDPFNIIIRPGAGQVDLNIHSALFYFLITAGSVLLYRFAALKNLQMYFCYADESGDGGLYDAKMPEKTGSP
jgi:hypothetical protein